MDGILKKVREALRSATDVEVIDDSAGTGEHYLDIEVDGGSYRLVLQDCN